MTSFCDERDRKREADLVFEGQLLIFISFFLILKRASS